MRYSAPTISLWQVLNLFARKKKVALSWKPVETLLNNENMVSYPFLTDRRQAVRISSYSECQDCQENSNI